MESIMWFLQIIYSEFNKICMETHSTILKWETCMREMFGVGQPMWTQDLMEEVDLGLINLVEELLVDGD